MTKEQNILNICHQAIQDEFDLTSKAEESLHVNESLKEDGACFVTLNLNGQLRGCIGSLIAQRPLGEDLIYNAKAAAFKDPRFNKLTPEEFEKVDIEVSLLSHPKILEYTDEEDLRQKVKVGEHGIILSHQGRQATFLPSVWEQLPDFDSFFLHLSHKAGLPQDILKYHPTIYTYTATKIKD